MNEKGKVNAGQEAAKSHGVMKIATGGVFDSVDRLAQAIKALGEKYNLVTPGGAIGSRLPMLYAAGISFNFVDPKHETYPIFGKAELGIGKNALDRIAAAAGIRWNPLLCGRIDDSSDPNFVEYQAAGAVLQLDGTERLIQASKRVDLRADKNTDISTWGADAREIARIAEAAKDAKGNPAPRDPWPQILQARQHILSLAETKAKNRAIRSLGIRTSYSEEEIKRGFAVVRLQFTGQSDDPATQNEIAMMIARRALSASDALYSGGVRQTERILSVRSVPKLAVVEEDDEKDVMPPPAAVQPASTQAATAPAENGVDPCLAGEPAEAGQAPAPPKLNPLLICGKKGEDGKYPRKAASEFSAESLRSKIAYYEKQKPNWDPRWAHKNQEELDAMKAWLALKEYDPRQGTFDMDQGGPCDDIPF